jgi:hypothetical protein
MIDLFGWCARKDDRWIEYVIEQNRGQFTDAFVDWIKVNYHVFGQFCKHAKALIKAGRKHYGAKTIIELVRYHTDIRQKGDEAFKVNNNYTSYLARLCMLVYPETDGLFDLRTVKKPYQNKENHP